MYKQTKAIILTGILALTSMGCAAQGVTAGIAEIIHGPAETAEVAAVKAQERIQIAGIMAQLSQERIECTAGCTIVNANEVAVAQMASALKEPTEAGFWAGVRDVSQTLITTTGSVINANADAAAMGFVAMKGFSALKDSGGEHNTVEGNGTVGGGTYNPETATPTVVRADVVPVPTTIVDPVVVDPVVVNPVVVNPEVVTQTNTSHTTTPALSLGE